MNIASKLKINALLSASMVLIVSLVFTLAFLMQRDAHERAMVADKLMRGAFELDLFSNSYLRYPEERPREQWLIRYNSLVKLLEESPFEKREQQVFAKRMKQSLNDMQALFDTLVAIQAQGRTASTELRSQLANLMLIRSREIAMDAARLATASSERIVAINRSIALGVPLIVIVMVLVAVRLSVRIGKSIKEPILKFRTGTEIIGSGSLDHRIGITTDDEIGELSRSFDRMAEQLQSITVSKNALEQEIEERKRTEEALRESEERFRFVADSIPHMVWATRPDGYADYYNQRVLDYVDRTLEQLQGWSWTEWIHPDDRQRAAEAWQNAIHTGSEHRIEFRIRNGRTGDYRWFMAHALPQRDRQGRILRWYGTCTDIHDRKLGEEILRAKEAELRLITDTTPLLLTRCSRDLRYVFVNRAYAEMLGRSPEEVAGKPIVEIMGSEGFETIRPYVEAVLQGQPVEYETEVPFKEIGPCALHVTYMPDRDLQGQVQGWVASISDITERKRMEEALRGSEQRYSSLFNNKTIGIAHCRTITDEHGKPFDYEILQVNDAYELITGGKKADIEGKTAREVFPGIEHFSFDYIGNYGKVALEGSELYFEVFFEALKQWLSIYVYSPLHGEFTAIFTDITNRKRAEEALRESEERFRKLAMHAPIGIFLTNVQGDSLYVNEKWSEITGLSSEQAKGQGWSSALHPDDRMRVFGAWYEATKAGREFTMEYRFRRPDGSTSWVYGSAIALKDEQGAITGYLGTIFDITERKKMEDTITHQAHHDLLTGLPNRALATDHLHFALTQAHRYQKQLAVMFLDLDRFKTINDTLGHSIGDELLKEVGKRLKPCIRETDTIARIGGDEFIVLLSQIAHAKDVSRIADKIMASFHQPFAIKDHTFYVTPSIGISMYPEDGTDAETLIKNADIAMYHAKEQGRNSYQFYNSSLNIRTLERMILENSLRRTLERGELELFYQPQFDISTGQIVCTEALIRWRHPELGLLNPMQFIPLAEEIGYIVSIDEWVLRTACEQNKAWQDAGYAPVCVTVNLSSRQFKQSNLVDTVYQILKGTGLEAKWLELEVTETIAMEDIEHTIPSVRKLNELGINFSIDDFGTGYSSLSYLKKLPIHKLKIDKSFIRDITTDPDDRTIVNAIISMAHSMNLKVVAEGVETAEQLSLLHASWCDEIQGYLGSHPLPTEEYEHFIKSNGHLQVK